MCTKKLERFFVEISNVELEICQDQDNKKFVRHHLYWNIVHNKKNPDPIFDCVIDNLNIMANNRVKSIKWAGYNFKFEKIMFDDGMEIEAVLIPLNMFEDFIRYHFTSYRDEPPENQCTRLARWLDTNSLNDLVT
jgi:hypothetical protein